MRSSSTGHNFLQVKIWRYSLFLFWCDFEFRRDFVTNSNTEAQKSAFIYTTGDFFFNFMFEFSSVKIFLFLIVSWFHIFLVFFEGVTTSTSRRATVEMKVSQSASNQKNNAHHTFFHHSILLDVYFQYYLSDPWKLSLPLLYRKLEFFSLDYQMFQIIDLFCFQYRRFFTLHVIFLLPITSTFQFSLLHPETSIFHYYLWPTVLKFLQL